MVAELELDEPLLRSRRNAKWTQAGPGMIPAWIAETDLGVSPAILSAVERLWRDQDFGYPDRRGATGASMVAEAFAAHAAAVHDWRPDPGAMLLMTGLDQALLAAILAYTDPGDGVLVQTPCYPPIRDAVLATGRQLIAHPLIETDVGFALDLTTLDAQAAQARLMIVVNPHNPTGRVLTEAELAALSNAARRHNLPVIADEVHADLTHPGHTHLPMAQLLPDRVVTLASPSKAYNIPGLRCALAHVASPDLRARWEARLPPGLLGYPSVVGMDAAIAAWGDSAEWLAQTRAHLTRMRDRLVTAIATRPGLRLHRPEATTLAWIGHTTVPEGHSAHEIWAAQGVMTMPGTMFDPACRDHVRVNFGTSAALLDQITARLPG